MQGKPTGTALFPAQRFGEPDAAVEQFGWRPLRFAAGTAVIALLRFIGCASVARMPLDDPGDEVAGGYDERSDPVEDPRVVNATADLLAELAGDGAALEFGVGTGRVALPLADRGVPVSGIELSPAVVAELRAKDVAGQIKATVGDMATTTVEGRFRLVYLVYNTICNLTTQDEQVACFANAAAHLEPGGAFVIEVLVPDLRRLPPGEDARVFSKSPGYVGYDHYVDPVAQRAVSHHFFATGAEVRESSLLWRYVWPSELDLMARLAGMSLAHRWSDWNRSPFTAESTKHVSVWRRPPAR